MKRAVLFSIMVVMGLLFALPAQAQTSVNLSSVLTWTNPDTTDPVQVEKGETVDGPFSVLATTSPNAVSFTDGKNAPGETSCYRLAYVNTSGAGPYSQVACKTFPSLPAVAPVLNPIQ